MSKVSMMCAAVLSLAVGCGAGGSPNSSMPPATPTEPQANSVAGTVAPGTAGNSAAPSGGNAPQAGAGASAPAPAAGSGSALPSAGATAAGSGGAGAAGVVAHAAGSGSGGESSAPPIAAEGAPAKLRRAVSADFLNKTLSIVDVDKLVDGAKREDALIGMVDLSKYAPGPLTLAVTPDGKTAVVSISSGWLGLVTQGIPAGDGTLVFVDLDKREVTGELNTGANPMGIAITQDGKHAFVGQMSDTYMAYVDIEHKTFDRIQTGNSWNEELAIDETGTIGMLTTGTAGDSLSFSVMKPMTHGQTVGLSGDAGGVAFFPGSQSAFVVQAPTQLTGNTGGYNVIDASDPSAPKVTDSNRVTGDSRKAYPVTSVPSRKSVVFPTTLDDKLTLTEMTLDAGKAKMVQAVQLGAATFSYGLSSSREGVVLAAVGSQHLVYVVDLNTGKGFSVPWGTTETGPMDVKYIP